VPEEENRSLTYRELAPRLIEHVLSLGVTHIELMPVAEHPYTPWWGDQVTGFYAPTSRYGTPDDLRCLVDACHAAGIGVLLDWVPAHFPRDGFALRRFDGTALYEHQDPRQGNHPDWGTHIFNLGRAEVRGFLLANALYWLNEFHFDGLRVDAVASMLYLDYSRNDGDWIGNRYGGKENLESIDFLRTLNELVLREGNGAITIAEESTSWPEVTGAAHSGGLGFTFKWNLGWMHDTLSYFSNRPRNRKFHHDLITFGMLYEHSEHFIMPLSHDEVVHGKGSLLNKMPGDKWQKFANLRLLMAYMYTRPGKKHIFMGTELASGREWNHDSSLDWHLLQQEDHAQFLAFMRVLGTLYRETPAFWSNDHTGNEFSWIGVDDHNNSVFSYLRRDANSETIVVLNMTPAPHHNYRIGVPRAGSYEVVLNSDQRSYGGSDYGVPIMAHTEAEPLHGFPQSLQLTVPPLAVLVLGHLAGGG
jgi:1,4-alpha-glucan branching enzyme